MKVNNQTYKQISKNNKLVMVQKLVLKIQKNKFYRSSKILQLNHNQDKNKVTVL